MRRDIPGTDNADQMLPVGNFLIGKLVKQAAHMDRQPSAVHVIGLFAQQIEKLGVHHADKEVEGAVGVRHDEEQRRFPVAQSVQFQLIVGGDLPQFGE